MISRALPLSCSSPDNQISTQSPVRSTRNMIWPSSPYHVIWYTCLHHQMETFSALLAFCEGNSPVTGEFPSQRPVMWSFDVFFHCVWINGWVNIREAGDLGRHCAHYDVIVMSEVQIDCTKDLSYWDMNDFIDMKKNISKLLCYIQGQSISLDLLQALDQMSL